MDKPDKTQIFSNTLQAAAVATARTPIISVEDDQQAPDAQRIRKMEKLKQQISDGTYKPDAAELSKRIVDDHLGEQL